MKNPIFSKSCLGWLALWVAFAACERDDTFCNTPHPAEGALLLHTGYAGNYYMKVQDYHTSVPAADFPCPQVFAPGSYTLSVFNLPEGMERADTYGGQPMGGGRCHRYLLAE